MPGKTHLFVYSTLRKGGKAAFLLKGSKRCREQVVLKGYAMYSAGAYPLVLPAPGASRFIVGDIYIIPVAWLPKLDRYEGNLYDRIRLSIPLRPWLYVWRGSGRGVPQASRFPPVPGGDWLAYQAEKRHG